jgi:hypothetical protein
MIPNDTNLTKNLESQLARDGIQEAYIHMVKIVLRSCGTLRIVISIIDQYLDPNPNDWLYFGIEKQTVLASHLS